MKRIENRGFTLLEIMIVVGVVALLVGVAVPIMLRSRMNANETSAQATLKSFATACETYAAANGALYPDRISDLTGGVPPYFSFDITVGSREGYTFSADFGAAADNGYTLTAAAIANAGEWDYRMSTGLILKRSPAGLNNWQLF